MPLSYQRKIHRGDIHPVTLHPCKRQEKLYLTEQRPDIPWIHLPSSGLVRIWSLGRSQQLFFCVFSHFRHGDERTNKRTTNQPGDPSASLLLTSEKAVLCNCTSDSLLTDCYWALNGLLLAFEDTNLIIDEYMGNFWSCDDCEDVHI